MKQIKHFGDNQFTVEMDTGSLNFEVFKGGDLFMLGVVRGPVHITWCLNEARSDIGYEQDEYLIKRMLKECATMAKDLQHETD